MKVACELRLCVSFCKSEAVGFVTSKHKFYPLVAEKNSDSVSVKIVFSISYYINKTKRFMDLCERDRFDNIVICMCNLKIKKKLSVLLSDAF